MLRKSTVQNFRFKVADKISDFPQKVYAFHDKFPDGAPRELAAMVGASSFVLLFFPSAVLLILFCFVADILSALAKEG